MKTYTIASDSISYEEREVTISIDAITKTLTMFSTIPKYTNKAIKNNWNMISQLVNPSGKIVGATFKMPENLISLRNSVTKRSVSPEQIQKMMNGRIKTLNK